MPADLPHKASVLFADRRVMMPPAPRGGRGRGPRRAADGGRAVIHRKADRYRYQPLTGDPLRLGQIIAKITADTEGYVAAEAGLAATVDRAYPAPLQRLWRAHFAQVSRPPDVIASLEDGFYSGASRSRPG